MRVKPIAFDIIVYFWGFELKKVKNYYDEY